MSLTPRIDKLDRNYIINGNFDFWQRGTSFTQGPAASGVYTADRWQMRSTGTGGINTISRQSLSIGQLSSLSSFQSDYFFRWNQTTLNTSDEARLIHRIENLKQFSGKTVTLSFIAKYDTSRQLRVRTLRNFGSGGSAEESSDPYATINITNQFVKYSITITVPDLSSRTFGAGNYLELEFKFPNNTTFTFDIAQVQLIEGSHADPEFTTAGRNYAEELQLCQRYYEKSYNQNVFPGDATGSEGFAVMQRPDGAGGHSIKFSVTKRINPVVTAYNPNTGTANQARRANDGGTTSATTQSADSGFRVNLGDGVSSIAYVLHWAADAEL